MSELTKLKRQARDAYLAYHAEVDGLDCGGHMAEVFRPAATAYRETFNATLDKLARIDPKTPTARL